MEVLFFKKKILQTFDSRGLLFWWGSGVDFVGWKQHFAINSFFVRGALPPIM